ncbi:MAG: glutamine synthetase family protein [Steroidobacteraceae bacterium]
MLPEEVRTAAHARSIVEERGLHHVKIGIFDNDGILRGKYIDRGKFFAALDKGIAFCDVVLGWDSNDVVYDNVKFTGWHTAYPDAMVRLLPGTCRHLPFEGDMLLFLGEFTGRAETVCPRSTLRRVIERAAASGYDVSAAAEFEFFIFNETPDSVRAKGYRDMQHMTPGYFGYSMLRASVHTELYQALLQLAADMRMPIEGLHTETGPGVLEAALKYTEALEAADRAALFKTFTKVLAQRRGLMATFMAKWSQQMPGQSGHLHVSMTRKNGSSAFYDEKKPHTMSDEMRWFVGGQQALMPELLAMVASTVNSYSRLVPGFWAPTSATWGVENRTCALRVIQGGPKSQRVEYRISAADINPYLAIAVAIGSGLWGIEHRIEPDEPMVGTAYDRKLPAKRQLPRTLSEAASMLSRSKAAQELFGAPFVEHFAASREWEEREFRRHVTDWELARYFEII